MTDSDQIGLPRDLDEARVKAFIRNEMWKFFLDLGWVTDLDPPPLRPRGEAAAETAEARFKAESVQLRGNSTPPPRRAKPQPAVTDPSAGKTRAEELAELRARFDPRNEGVPAPPDKTLVEQLAELRAKFSPRPVKGQ
jgi:hypothetical protein